MDKLIVIGGPCSVESKEQLEAIYPVIEDSIDIFRGGAYKPRTSVHSFQGLGAEGIQLLTEVSNKPVISEIMDGADIELFKDVDYVQIGARNMQNFALLKTVGKSKAKVLLKRGLSSTVSEWLAAAEYLEYYGATEVILCERGIRTFSDAGRFTMDLSAVLKVKDETDYKVIVDISHPAGERKYISRLARAAVSCSADGVMIESHNDPDNALSDTEQQITPTEFVKLIDELQQIKKLISKLEQ